MPSVVASTVASDRGRRAEEERRARAVDDLREDVVALVGRAEEVVPAKAPAARRAARRLRVVRREQRREDRHEDHPARTMIPKRDFGFASSRRSHAGSRASAAAAATGAPRGRRPGGASRGDRLSCGRAPSARPHARVEDEVEDVHDEVGDDHASPRTRAGAPGSAGSRCRARPAAASSPRPGS